MNFSNKELQNLADSLKQQRDELKVKLHLAKADARDEWNRLEGKWEEIRTKTESAYDEAGKTAGAVSTALQIALDEIKKGYDRIRRTL